MIDEQTSETASLFVFNLLEPAEAQAFYHRAEADPALRAHVDELMAAAAALAHAAPPQTLPPGCQARVLEAIRQAPMEPAIVAPAAQPKIISFPGRAPLAGAGWAAAACLALACGWLISERSRLRSEVAELNQRDELARVQIATLSSKLQQAPDATAVVVWDEQKQRGLLKTTRMPAPGENRDYQLWVIDPQYAKPVSAGVFKVDRPEITRVAFQTAKPITSAQNFAVSLEERGGADEVHGPIVMSGE